MELQSEKDVIYEVAEGEGWFDVKLKVNFVYKPSISLIVKKGGFYLKFFTLIEVQYIRKSKRCGFTPA
jgi:hypothetical protein